MFVCATTGCFPQDSLPHAIEKLQDLEYGQVEVFIHESSNQLKPSEVLSYFENPTPPRRELHRLFAAAYSLDIEGDNFDRQFIACSKLAKLNRVVTLVLRSSVQGTPYNEEIERLKSAVHIATLHGCSLSVMAEKGRMTEDLDTVRSFCDHIPGLGVALDTSYCVGLPNQSPVFDSILPKVNHVRLRDSREDAYQVRVGQGTIEFGKLISQLECCNYNRALSVDIAPMDGLDHAVELRKMRLLLESLL